MNIELLIGTIAIGLGATLVMDLWSVFLKQVFAIPSPDYCLVGRWLCHMTDGTFKHSNITAAVRKPAECRTGWIAHYVTGVLFALGLVILATPQWLQAPTPEPALVFGIVTVGFPLFVMQPAFGLGFAASKTPNPFQARLRSFMNHIVFGFGLYLCAAVLRALGLF